MAKQWHLIDRFTTDLETISHVRAGCTASGKFTWITRDYRLRVHTLRGVRGDLADVLLPDSTDDLYPWVCDLGRKTGSYNGRDRFRLTFRPWDIRSAHTLPPKGRLSIEEQDGGLALVATWGTEGMWAQRFPLCRYAVHSGELRGIFMHHYYQWFRFLPREEAQQAAELWATLPAVREATDIVAINRLAGSMLYDLARQLGWRKLTVRERQRMGLGADAKSWHRHDGMILRDWYARNGSRNGAGEYSTRAAGNDTQYIRTSYGTADVE